MRCREATSAFKSFSSASANVPISPPIVSAFLGQTSGPKGAQWGRLLGCILTRSSRDSKREEPMKIYFKGRMSTFGGPADTGVTPREGLALITKHNKHEFTEYLLPHQPAGTTGLARDLNPQKFYVACRWDYKATGARRRSGDQAGRRASQ